MNYANLISAMSAVIKANGNNEITGDLLQQVLRAIINSLGQGYQFMGVATTATDPGTQDARLFYFAEGPGTYPNFGPLTIPDDGQVYLLVLGASWVAVQLPIPTFAGFSDLVTEVAGKMALVPAATEGNVAEFGDAGQVRDGGVQTSALARRDAGATAGNLAEFDGNGDPKDSGIAAEDVMKIPAGLMPFGPAGLAEALLDTDSEGAGQEFALRPSGGDGGAYFRRLLGNTKAFNQLVENGDFSNGTTGWANSAGAVVSVADGVVTLHLDATGSTQQLNLTKSNFPYVTGNKYHILALVKCNNASTQIVLIPTGTTADGYVPAAYYANWTPVAMVWTRVGTSAALQIRGNNATNPDADIDFSVRYVMVSDLTAMQDNSTTPEEFREKFPLPYYAYGRKLIHNKVAKVITKGANQWDEVWESGTIDPTTGQNAPSSSSIRSKNYIPVIGGATYYNKGYTLAIVCYDANKNFVQSLGGVAVGEFTIPAGVAFIRFSRTATAYANDICINLSNADINGTYFPYWKRELNIDITNREDTNGTKPFADGFKSAGSAADYANEVGGAKVMGVVDLGSLDWTKFDTADGTLFRTTQIDRVQGVLVNAICAAYPLVPANSRSNKTLSGGSNNYVDIIDNGYSDAATFKTAMAGVKLVYELNTPVPFTWKEPLNTGIKVSKYGTEEITPAQTENIDNAPFRAVTTYSISVANLVAALSAVGNRGGAKGPLGGSNQEENPGNGEELTPEEETPKEETDPIGEETPTPEPVSKK